MADAILAATRPAPGKGEKSVWFTEHLFRVSLVDFIFYSVFSI